MAGGVFGCWKHWWAQRGTSALAWRAALEKLLRAAAAAEEEFAIDVDMFMTHTQFLTHTHSVKPLHK